MKQDLHPTYFPEAKVICACGNIFTTGATVADIKVDICNMCHPFFTGKEKLIDTEGRIEKFQRRMSSKVEPKAKKITEQKEVRPVSLKEMLQSARKNQG